MTRVNANQTHMDLGTTGRIRARLTTRSERFTDLDADKLRGGYYTSAPLAAWLSEWALRTSKDHVLEPSCGDGSFLVAAAERLRALGATPAVIKSSLVGVEIISAEARRATSRLEEIIGKHAASVIQTSDFFSWWCSQTKPRHFDAVIGNPPFIRYQSFPEPHRTRAMTIMQQLGLTPNRLTNIWVPFVVAAAASLSEGGRLALVLPAELLQVTYAGQLRAFLTDRFSRIDIVACNELFFEKAEQEVVLLLADGALAAPSTVNTCRVALTEAHAVADITDRAPSVVLRGAAPKTLRHDNEKWLKYFLSESEIAFMRELRSSLVAAPLSDHGSVDVGVVTGKNEFFVLSGQQVQELDLDGYTIPLVSRSIQLKGSVFKQTEWRKLAAGGDRVHLLDLKALNGSKPPKSLRAYISQGEAAGYHKGYKCSIREPWYAVPSIWNPQGFLFRQIYDFPRFVLNQAGATSTDTIHRFSCEGDPSQVVANTYTYLTAASAEIEGRSYGGGVLELEPTEAERLLMPARLGESMPLAELDKLVRAGDLAAALDENSRLVLSENMGLSRRDCTTLRDIWIRMRDRRLARRRTSRTTPTPATVE